jgi:hypothetical protein
MESRAVSKPFFTRSVAQKLRVAIHKELENIQKGGLATNETTRFEKVEKLMEK